VAVLSQAVADFRVAMTLVVLHLIAQGIVPVIRNGEIAQVGIKKEGLIVVIETTLNKTTTRFDSETAWYF
jgi:hypothetical protein